MAEIRRTNVFAKHDSFRSLLLISLFFVLPFFHKWSTFILVTSLAASIPIFLNGINRREICIFWFLPLLFVYYATSELLTGGDLGNVEKRLVLIAAPVLFMTNLDILSRENCRKFSISFVAGVILAIFICFLRALIRSLSWTADNRLLFDAAVIKNGEYGFFDSAVMGGNYFFSDELSLFISQPTYFSLMVVFAQFILLMMLSRHSQRKVIVGIIGLYLIAFVAIFFLSSKAVIITSLILTTVGVLSIKSRSRFQNILYVIILIAVCAVFMTNPRMKQLVSTMSVSLSNPDPNAKYGHALRALSWRASFEVISDNWLTGVGEGRKEDVLMEKYRMLGYRYPAEWRHNSHNMYLDILISGGLIFFVFFLAGVIALFATALREKHLSLKVFLIIFLFNCLFENLLSRHPGILFFSVFVSMFLYQTKFTDRMQTSADSSGPRDNIRIRHAL